MKKVNEPLGKRLDNELEQIHFTRQQDVLKKVNRIRWKEKLHKLWNKEISIPLVPIGTAFGLLIMTISYMELYPLNQMDTVNQEKQLIEVAGNYYWKDDLERALKDESKDEG